jgi:hypothetical protein
MDNQFKIIIGDIVDSDPCADFEADLGLAYADVDPETVALPLE